MPETGNHATLIIVLLGVACMTIALIKQTKKRKEEKKDEKNDKI